MSLVAALELVTLRRSKTHLRRSASFAVPALVRNVLELEWGFEASKVEGAEASSFAAEEVALAVACVTVVVVGLVQGAASASGSRNPQGKGLTRSWSPSVYPADLEPPPPPVVMDLLASALPLFAGLRDRRTPHQLSLLLHFQPNLLT